MANESNTPTQTASEEIDLRALLKAIGNFIQRGFQAGLSVILYIRRLSIQYLKVGIVLGALSAGMFLALWYMKAPVYTSSMIMSSSYFKGSILANSFNKLDRLAKEDNHVELAAKLGIDSAQAALIKHIDVEVVMNFEDRRRLEGLIHGMAPRDNFVLYQNLVSQLSIENESTYNVIIGVKDPAIIPLMDSAIFNFVKGKEYLSRRLAADRAVQENRLAKLAEEREKLDSLRTIVNMAWLAEATSEDTPGSNNVYIGGEEEMASPLRIMNEEMELFSQQQSILRDMAVGSDLEIVDGFNRIQKPTKDSIVAVLIRAFMWAYIATLAIGLALDFNRYLNRVEAARKEEKGAETATA